MRAGHVWPRIAPAHEGPRSESNNNAHEPTSGRSTHYGSGHLIRVFRDSGHIFSSLYSSLAVPLLSRFAPSRRLVAFRQTFVHRCHLPAVVPDLRERHHTCLASRISMASTYGSLRQRLALRSANARLPAHSARL